MAMMRYTGYVRVWLFSAMAVSLLLPMAAVTRPIFLWVVLCFPVGAATGAAVGWVHGWLDEHLNPKESRALRALIAIVLAALMLAGLLWFRWYGTNPFAGLDKLQLF